MTLPPCPRGRNVLESVFEGGGFIMLTQRSNGNSSSRGSQSLNPGRSLPPLPFDERNTPEPISPRSRIHSELCRPSRSFRSDVKRGAEVQTAVARRSAAEAGYIAARIRQGSRTHEGMDSFILARPPGAIPLVCNSNSVSSSSASSSGIKGMDHKLRPKPPPPRKLPLAPRDETTLRTKPKVANRPGIARLVPVAIGDCRPQTANKSCDEQGSETPISKSCRPRPIEIESPSPCVVNDAPMHRDFTVPGMFSCLPEETVVSLTSYLGFNHLIGLVLSHNFFTEIVDDVGAWVIQDQLGLCLREIRCLPGLSSMSALRLTRFLLQQREAVKSAREQQLGAGLRHSVVFKGGKVYTFGAATFGQVGAGPGLRIIDVPKPIPVIEPVASVSCGGDHSLLVGVSGAVWAFGRNVDGQCGTGEIGGTVYHPKRATGITMPAVQASCGADHSLLLDIVGGVWACGRGVEGQLGRSIEHEAVPQRVKGLPSKGCVLVACGADHSLVLDAAGRVFAFGENSKGQLGLGNRRSTSIPTHMKLTGGVLAVQVACGGAHSLVLGESGRVFGFGGNEHGQLGLLDASDQISPTSIVLGVPRSITRVCCGFSHSMLVTASGQAWSLGGKFEDSKANDPIPPRRLGGEMRGAEVVAVAAGGEHSLCLAADAVYAFGSGQEGQLGLGPQCTQCPLPRRLDIAP